jgi:hypothetical protein
MIQARLEAAASTLCQGAFSGSVVMRNQTRLVLESGVTGLSFTVASGAYCDVADWNVAYLYHYSAGILSFDEDLNAGTIAQLSWLNSTSINAVGFYQNGLNRTDAVANPVGPCSYIIDVVDSTYRMINQTTGQVDCYSPNFYQVFTYAIGNTTIGKILLGAGSFIQNRTGGVGSPFYIQSNQAVWIEGLGQDIHEGENQIRCSANTGAFRRVETRLRSRV